jgi:hypothetical protein
MPEGPSRSWFRSLVRDVALLSALFYAVGYLLVAAGCEGLGVSTRDLGFATQDFVLLAVLLGLSFAWLTSLVVGLPWLAYSCIKLGRRRLGEHRRVSGLLLWVAGVLSGLFGVFVVPVLIAGIFLTAFSKHGDALITTILVAAGFGGGTWLVARFVERQSRARSAAAALAVAGLLALAGSQITEAYEWGVSARDRPQGVPTEEWVRVIIQPRTGMVTMPGDSAPVCVTRISDTVVISPRGVEVLTEPLDFEAGC